MSIRTVLLVLPLLLSQCKDPVNPQWSPECSEGEYSITHSLFLKFKNTNEMEFDSIESPTGRAIFHTRELVRSANSLYPYNILSPDKKWIVLKTGDAEGFVFCKKEHLLECVRQDCFEGKFNLEFDYEDDDPGDRLFVDFLKWEDPATLVFYDVDRDKDNPPCLEKDVYKINLETGNFTLPKKPNPVIKPVLKKENPPRNSQH